jgi:hypothetical protein
MGSTDLVAALRVRPFEPFRVVTSDGTIYEIRHADLVLVSPSTAVIGFPDPAQPGVAARYDIVSLRHIIRLEQLLPASEG